MKYSRKLYDMIGKKYSRLTVMARDHSVKKRTKWFCVCDCGKISSVRSEFLISGRIKSCGCLHRKTSIIITLTQDILKTIVSYDSKTGVFIRLISSSNIKAGNRTGNFDGKGYIRISILDKTHAAHRLAWLYIYGEWPKGDIDHINGVKDDNRICNLREATRAQNLENVGKKISNTSGYKGVYWGKANQKWQVQCRAYGKRHWVGSFNTPEEASDAYEKFAKENHGNFYYREEVI